MPRPDSPDGERVSLAGPDPEAVLRALLKVDPEAEPDVYDDSAQDGDEKAPAD